MADETVREPRIGYIGQGWVGRTCADQLEADGHRVVRYALEAEYRGNKSLIADCEIVFIAVPTPVPETGQDCSAVIAALGCVGAGHAAIIRSTLAPGMTEQLQAQFEDLIILHCPEFLVQATAAHDVAHPSRSLIGMPRDTEAHRKYAGMALKLMPDAPYQRIIAARDAEMAKIASNGFLLTKVLYFNLVYDLAQAQGCDWAAVEEAITRDPRIGPSHAQPLHSGGRGAGGACLPKDFEAFRQAYCEHLGGGGGADLIDRLMGYNEALLSGSDKS